MIKKCIICGKILVRRKYKRPDLSCDVRLENLIQFKKRNTCSSNCRYQHLGQILSKQRKGKYHKGHKFQKGHIPWHKGLKNPIPNSGFQKGHKYWDNPNSRKARFQEGHKINLGRWNGKNSPNWKGGTTLENKIARQSYQWRQWRKAVFERDNYTCWICERQWNDLVPHHLKKFSDYPKLRFMVSNGLTLCEFCHKTYTKFK